MSVNKKQTGKAMIVKASQILRDENSSEIKRKLAGSLLSQSNSNNQTGEEMETIASNVLKSSKYNEETKSLAASLLTQSNKDR